MAYIHPPTHTHQTNIFIGDKLVDNDLPVSIVHLQRKGLLFLVKK